MLPIRARLVVALLASIVVGGCAMNPVTGKTDIGTMSEAQEIELGKREHPKILQEYGRYDDEALQAYVSALGQRIVAVSERPNIPFTFTVIDSEIVNAFSTPGYVYVSRGLLAYLNSEAELVGVLGHEVGHVTARHMARQQSGATAATIGATLVGILTGSGGLAAAAGEAGGAAVMSYSRDMEIEADGIGATYLARLGYDPQAMIDVIGILKSLETFEYQRARQEGRNPQVDRSLYASHPDNDARLQAAEAKVTKNDPGVPRPDGRQVYLDHIKGMPFGTSRSQGVVRGSRFYHADMGITFAFPTGWTVQNLQDNVVGYTPRRDAYLELSAQAVPPNMTPREFLLHVTAGVPIIEQEPLQVNGLPAYTVLARDMPLPWGNRGPVRYVVVYLNNLAYIFVGATRLNSSMSTVDPLFLSSAKTLRRLKDNEYARAEPDRIELVESTPQTKIEELAKSSPITPYPAEQLRLLNDLYPDGEPSPGELLKVVD